MWRLVVLLVIALGCLVAAENAGAVAWNAADWHHVTLKVRAGKLVKWRSPPMPDGSRVEEHVYVNGERVTDYDERSQCHRVLYGGGTVIDERACGAGAVRIRLRVASTRRVRVTYRYRVFTSSSAPSRGTPSDFG